MSVTRVTDAIFVRECSKALRSTVLQLVLTLLGYRNGSCRLAQVTISIRQMVFLTSCTESSLAEHLAVSDCFTNQVCNLVLFGRSQDNMNRILLCSSKGAPVVQTMSHA